MALSCCKWYGAQYGVPAAAASAMPPLARYRHNAFLQASCPEVYAFPFLTNLLLRLEHHVILVTQIDLKSYIGSPFSVSVRLIDSWSGILQRKLLLRDRIKVVV